MSSLVTTAILVGGAVTAVFLLAKPVSEATAKIVTNTVTPSSASEIVSSIVTPITKGGQIATVIEAVADKGVPAVQKIAHDIPGVGGRIDREKEAQKVGFRGKDYSECLEGYNCLSSDSHCINGQCIPYVPRDDAAPWIKWNPEELGLRKYCGKYYLQGQAGKCDSNWQCSDTGITSEVGIDNGKSSTVSSRFYCNNNGICQAKGQNFLGTWYKRPEDDPFVFKGSLNYTLDKRVDNRDKIQEIYRTIGENTCRSSIARDNPGDWFPNQVPV